MIRLGPSSARRLAWIVGSASIALLLGALTFMYLDRDLRSPFHCSGTSIVGEILLA